MQLRFQRRAIREYQAALSQYDQISSHLGDRFVAAMDEARKRILSDPTSHPVEPAAFRRVRVRKFPYVQFFCMLSEDIVGVVAVAHTSRRPGYWRRRRFDS